MKNNFWTLTFLALIACSQKNTNKIDVNTIQTDSSSVSSVNYSELGRNLAMQTKGQIGKNLALALSTKGPAGAVDFCNTRAIFITDSMATVLNAHIKRVSDKPRNSMNTANAEETEFINELKSLKSKGMELSSKITETEDKIIGYYPIETNEMCMQCHGEPQKQIDNSTLNVLKKLYPKDMAVGYKANEIRGIFVVEMKKK